MIHFMLPQDEPLKSLQVPQELSIFPLPNLVMYPGLILPLVVRAPQSIALIEDAIQNQGLIGLVTAKDSTLTDPILMPGQMYETGTVARLQHVFHLSTDAVQITLQGLERFRVKWWAGLSPYMRARVEPLPDIDVTNTELEALQRSVCEVAGEIMAVSLHVPRAARNFLEHLTTPHELVYVIAANAQLDITEAQRILEAETVTDQLQLLLMYLMHEKEVVDLSHTITESVHHQMETLPREEGCAPGV